MITYDLTTTNVSGTPTADYAQVAVQLLTSTTAQITFDAESVGGKTWLFHSNGAVGVDVNASSWTIGSISGISTNGGSISSLSDGGSSSFGPYGTLNESINSKKGNDRWSEISFVVTDKSGTWASASKVLASPFAAAQVAPSDGSATGFAGNAVATPEPSTMAIAALGTLGFVAYALRRRAKK